MNLIKNMDNTDEVGTGLYRSITGKNPRVSHPGYSAIPRPTISLDTQLGHTAPH